ncbi:hypothetical protein G6F68_009595 [Rhizopus microsporus]|nr:hypothetical protein G6F68_009595 [Rhizopus microsporus]
MIAFSRNGAVIADGEGVCRPAVAAIAAALQPTGRLVQQAGQIGGRTQDVVEGIGVLCLDDAAVAAATANALRHDAGRARAQRGDDASAGIARIHPAAIAALAALGAMRQDAAAVAAAAADALRHHAVALRGGGGDRAIVGGGARAGGARPGPGAGGVVDEEGGGRAGGERRVPAVRLGQVGRHPAHAGAGFEGDLGGGLLPRLRIAGRDGHRHPFARQLQRASPAHAAAAAKDQCRFAADAQIHAVAPVAL